MRGNRSLTVLAVTVALAAGLVSGGGGLASAGTSRVAPPAASAPHVRLPDLTMLPLKAFHLDKVNGKPVLRFSAIIINTSSSGPMEVLATRPNTRSGFKVRQRIYDSKGVLHSVSTRAVVRYAALDGHRHFHVLNLEQYRIRPINSRTWRSAHKEGFCFTDDARYSGNARRGYYEAWGSCAPKRPNALTVKMGLTPGWIDNYNWSLPGQTLSLVGFRLPGLFCVDATADPLHLLREARTDNNRTSMLVRIRGRHIEKIRQGC